MTACLMVYITLKKIKHLLLKMLNFQRLSNNPQEIYEVSVLEACRV